MERSQLGRLWGYAHVSGSKPAAVVAAAPLDEEVEADGSGGADSESQAVAGSASPAHSRQLENFTTEALAGALRLDPTPLFDLLAERGIGEPKMSKDVEVGTQVELPGDRSRHLDAVLWLTSRKRGSIQVWIEAKVHAPPSGCQLKAYHDASRAEEQSDGVPRFLVWLGPDDPPTDQQEYVDGTIHWQFLADAVARASRALDPAAAWYWNDLIAFLRENGMTDDRTYPITAREATVLDDMRRLWLKTRATLIRVNAWGKETITEWAPETYFYKTDRLLKSELRDCLVDHGELLIKHGSLHPVFLKHGVSPYRGEAYLVVRVVTKRPKDQDLRQAFRSRFDPLLELDWILPNDGDIIAERSARAVNFARQEDAEEWLKLRLTELRGVDFYNLAKSMK